MFERTSREIRLKSRPVGLPDDSTFELVEVAVPEPGEGEVLVENLFMSVDPYMRGRMVDRKSYVPPFQVGAVLEGGAVGRVVESRSAGFEVGDHVLSMKGWREHYVTGAAGLQKVDGARAPLSYYLGVLGMPGLTAYVGLLDIGKPVLGETVFVSGASGAVGSAVCQIAKGAGCRVVGTAGSDAKVRWLLDEAGVDAAINYKTVGKLRPALRDACPDGIDIYFDNVGGEHLEAALWELNDFGRIVACGSISGYNDVSPTPGPSNLFQIITKRVVWKGFIVMDHFDRMPSFTQDMAGWLRDGTVRCRETVYRGIESAPDAFRGLFSGENIGKMIVQLGEEAA